MLPESLVSSRTLVDEAEGVGDKRQPFGTEAGRSKSLSHENGGAGTCLAIGESVYLLPE